MRIVALIVVVVAALWTVGGLVTGERAAPAARADTSPWRVKVIRAPGVRREREGVRIAPDRYARVLTKSLGRSRYRVSLRIERRDGARVSERELARGLEGTYGGDVVVGRDGTAAVSWVECVGVDVTDEACVYGEDLQALRVMVRPPGGEFGPAETISESGPINANLLYARADGELIAVFQAGGDLYTAARRPGATFSPSHRLGGAGPAAIAIADGPDGRTVVAWLDQYVDEGDYSSIFVSAATRPADSDRFGRARRLAAPDPARGGEEEYAGSLGVVVGRGVTIVSWAQYSGCRVAIAAPDGRFGRAIKLSSRGALEFGDFYPLGPRVGLAPDGAALIAWQSSRREIRARRRRADGRLLKTERIRHRARAVTRLAPRFRRGRPEIVWDDGLGHRYVAVRRGR